MHAESDQLRDRRVLTLAVQQQRRRYWVHSFLRETEAPCTLRLLWDTSWQCLQRSKPRVSHNRRVTFSVSGYVCCGFLRWRNRGCSETGKWVWKGYWLLAATWEVRINGNSWGCEAGAHTAVIRGIALSDVIVGNYNWFPMTRVMSGIQESPPKTSFWLRTDTLILSLVCATTHTEFSTPFADSRILLFRRLGGWLNHWLIARFGELMTYNILCTHTHVLSVLLIRRI